MSPLKTASNLDKTRTEIAAKVRELRKSRRFTQAELAGQLGLSQSRLSEIEKGAGSFSAEQFLRILQLFNVELSHFAPSKRKSLDAVLQNALARLGAPHLHESTELLPSERLSEVQDVLREVLISAESPRLIAALAPVVVINIRHLNIGHLLLPFTEAGLERRLGWLLENILDAVQRESQPGLQRPWSQLYRRAAVPLEVWLTNLKNKTAPQLSTLGALASDILDPDIRSKKTVEEVAVASSQISKRWGIVTSLQPADFVEALRAARASH